MVVIELKNPTRLGTLLLLGDVLSRCVEFSPGLERSSLDVEAQHESDAHRSVAHVSADYASRAPDHCDQPPVIGASRQGKAAAVKVPYLHLIGPRKPAEEID